MNPLPSPHWQDRVRPPPICTTKGPTTVTRKNSAPAVSIVAGKRLINGLTKDTEQFEYNLVVKQVSESLDLNRWRQIF